MEIHTLPSPWLGECLHNFPYPVQLPFRNLNSLRFLNSLIPWTSESMCSHYHGCWYTEKRLVSGDSLCPLVWLNPLPIFFFHLKPLSYFWIMENLLIRKGRNRTIKQEAEERIHLSLTISKTKTRCLMVPIHLQCSSFHIDSESHQRFSETLGNVVVVTLVGCGTLSESWARSSFRSKFPWEKFHQWQGKKTPNSDLD